MVHLHSGLMVTELVQGDPLTEIDLPAFPPDSRRYELIDGTLVVTPAPSRYHQRCLLRLSLLLETSRTPEYEVLVAPFDVRLSHLTLVQPDILLTQYSPTNDARLETAPLLAIEIASPSTRRIDLGTKRLVYEEYGVPAYWMIDPEEPSLTVLHLENGEYVQVAHVVGDEAYEAAVPFPVTVVPARLLR
jgi:Uma2 family endonuclease